MKIIPFLTGTIIFLTSCTFKILLQPEKTDLFNQPSYANYLPLSQTDSTLCYLNDLGKLYAYKSGDSAMEIGSLYYVDDKQIDNQAQLNSSPEKYSDLFFLDYSFSILMMDLYMQVCMTMWKEVSNII